MQASIAPFLVRAFQNHDRQQAPISRSPSVRPSPRHPHTRVHVFLSRVRAR
jgi:hypothetical protein